MSFEERIGSDREDRRSFELKNVVPFVPAIVMWLGAGVVFLRWMIMAAGGQVTPGTGSTLGGLMLFFAVLFLLAVAGAIASVWAARWRHRAVWAIASFVFAFVFFMGSLGD